MIIFIIIIIILLSRLHAWHEEVPCPGTESKVASVTYVAAAAMQDP